MTVTHHEIIVGFGLLLIVALLAVAMRGAVL